MKYLSIILIILITSCSTTKQQTCVIKHEIESIKIVSLQNELNQSVIDGFFNGDTTLIPNNTYFIR